MNKIVYCCGKGDSWLAKSPRYPEIVSKGRTKLEARAKFREAAERLEKYLKSVESDPRFIEMMKRSDADIRAGRVYTQEEVREILFKKRQARKT